MTPTACTVEYHESLKRDPAAWSALRHIGDQHVDADEDGPAWRVELRNCACGCTLGKRVS